MCGEDLLGSALGAIGEAGISAASAVGTQALTKAVMGDGSKSAQVKMPAMPGPPAQAAPSRKADTGAVIKIGGIDDEAEGAGTSVSRRRGGTSLGGLGANIAL